MRNKIEWILLLTAIAVGGIFALKKCTGKPAVVVTTTDSVQYWKDRAGALHAAVIKSQEDFARAGFKMDSLARLLKTKPKNIESFAQVITHGQDTLHAGGAPKIIYGDSARFGWTLESNWRLEPGSDTVNWPAPIKSLQETFWNDYYTADVRIDADGDSSYMTLKSTDTAYLSWRKVQTGNIFHRQQFIELDAWNANKNNTIVGLKGYRLPQKTTAWNRWIKPTLVGLATGAATVYLTTK